jgi:hypothetical protein
MSKYETSKVQRTNKKLLKAITPDTVGESFVLNAVAFYSKAVLADSTSWGERSLINQDLWKTIAKHNLELMGEKQ